MACWCFSPARRLVPPPLLLTSSRPSQWGSTAVMLAALEGHHEIARFLCVCWANLQLPHSPLLTADALATGWRTRPMPL